MWHTSKYGSILALYFYKGENMGEADLPKPPVPQEKYFASGRAHLSPGEQDFVRLSDILQTSPVIRIVPEEPNQEKLEPNPLPAPTIYLRGVFPHKGIRPDEIPEMTIEKRPGEDVPVLQIKTRGPGIATEHEFRHIGGAQELPLGGPCRIYGHQDTPLFTFRFENTDGAWRMTFVGAFQGKGRLDTLRQINRAGIPPLEAQKEELQKRLDRMASFP